MERVGTLGEGVGEDSNGNTYFVSGLLPGDRALVEFAETKKRYRKASLVELIEPSSDRVVAPCAVFGECGGCDWLHWSYSKQLAAKEGLLKYLLQKYQLSVEDLRPILAADQVLGYRHRIQVKRRDGKIGFCKRHSHEIVDVSVCPVAHPKINEALAKLRSSPGEFGEMELLVSEVGSVQVQPLHETRPFSQSHREMNETLRAEVAGELSRLGSQKILELYCGDGNLTQAYAGLAERIVAIDSCSAAIEKARDHLGLQGVEFHCTPVDERLGERIDFQEYDTLLLDPPRAGIGHLLERFVHPRVRVILYISCSPLSFVQDISSLKNFAVQRVLPLDMFPQTRHLELIATLVRR